MVSGITEFLARDHDRLDALFTKARADEARVDLEGYEEFRRGLLRHVGMEELILIPAPTPKILAAIRAILEPHNLMEEEADGLYAQCEKALGAEAESILARLRAAPEIPPAAHAEGPHVEASIRRALEAAGHGSLELR